MWQAPPWPFSASVDRFEPGSPASARDHRRTRTRQHHGAIVRSHSHVTVKTLALAGFLHAYRRTRQPDRRPQNPRGSLPAPPHRRSRAGRRADRRRRKPSAATSSARRNARRSAMNSRWSLVPRRPQTLRRPTGWCGDCPPVVPQATSSPAKIIGTPGNSPSPSATRRSAGSPPVMVRMREVSWLSMSVRRSRGWPTAPR